MNNLFNDIFKEFEMLFPEIAKNVTDGYVSGRQEITVFLSDGSKGFYDGISKTIRFLKDIKTEHTEDNWRKEFGNCLNEKLYKKGISQRELSEKTQISQPVISRFINGLATPSTYDLIQISEALDCSIADLTYF